MRRFWSLFLLFLLASSTWAQIATPGSKKVKIRKNSLRDTASTKYNFIWDKELRKNVIRFNPVSAFVLVGNLDYERRFSKLVTFNINAMVGANTNYNDTMGRVYPTNFFLAGGGFSLRFYPFQKAVRGFYLGPYVDYRYFKLTSLKEESFNQSTGKAITSLHKAEAQLLSFGVMTGYQWILGNWFALNLFAGGGYTIQHWQSWDSPRENFSVQGLGIRPYQIRLGVSIGIAPK